MTTQVSANAATPRTLTAKVERVGDGKTIIAVSSNQSKVRIPLLEIDAHEIPHRTQLRQPFGQEARDYPNHLIGGKTVRVDAYDPDR